MAAAFFSILTAKELTHYCKCVIMTESEYSVNAGVSPARDKENSVQVRSEPVTVTGSEGVQMSLGCLPEKTRFSL